MNFKLNLGLFATIMCLVSCEKEDIIMVDQDMDVFLDSEIDNHIPKSEQETPEIPNAIENWIHNRQQSSGLMESSENSDFTSLYDNALAAIFFIKTNDKDKAERIFDFFLNIADTELSKNGGFYQFRKSDGSHPERVWMGDNAWLLIALQQYSEKFASDKYASLELQLENWLRSLQTEDGALKGGINSDGSEIPNVTEGIITAFHAIKGYDTYHRNILAFLEKNRWDSNLGLLMAWPENPKYAYALDVISLSKSIFNDLSDDGLFQANKFLNEQTATVSGKPISGYCFDEDKDVVWLEGTAQMAVAFNSIQRPGVSKQIINNIEKTFIESSLDENAKGIPYTANHGTSYGENMLWDHTDITPALSSTLWYYFAKTGFNPLNQGQKTTILEEDKFWLPNYSN